MKMHASTAAFAALALATGLAACSHDKTKPDETALVSPTPAAPATPPAETVASSTATDTGTSAVSPTTEVAAMETQPAPEPSSTAQSKDYEKSNRK